MRRWQLAPNLHGGYDPGKHPGQKFLIGHPFQLSQDGKGVVDGERWQGVDLQEAGIPPRRRI